MSFIRQMQILLFMMLFLVAVNVFAATDQSIDDPRLDKKITLSLGIVTLEKFAEEVTKQTGVTIEAGKSKKDWQVKERKTIVFAKDMPAKDILFQVAKLHHYTLSGYGEGDKRYYQYWQDLRSRKEESELREFGEVDLTGKCKKAVSDLAELSKSADKMTSAQLAELEKSHPYQHFLLTDPFGKATCNFAAQMPPEIWDSQGKWSYPIKSPGMLDAARQLITRHRELEPTSDPNAEGPVEISFEPTVNMGDGEIRREMGELGELQIRAKTGDSASIMLLNSLDSSFGEFIAKMVIAMRAGGDQSQASVKVELPKKDDTLKDDPLMKEKVKIKKGHDYVSLLQAVHETTGTPILGDSYREKETGVIEGEVSVKAVIGMLELVFHKEVEKEDSRLLISDKFWYEKREADIQQVYLDALRKKVEEQGLGLKDMESIACDLSDTQILSNLLVDKDFEGFKWYMQDTPQIEALRFFAGLTSQETAAMTGESKLPVEQLGQDTLNHALEAVNKTADAILNKGAMFSGYQEEYSDTGVLTQKRANLGIPQADGKLEYEYVRAYCAPPKPAGKH